MKKHEMAGQPDLSKALLLKGKTLEVQPEKQSTAKEKKFTSEKELKELVVNNHTVLFGERTVMVDATHTEIKAFVLLDFTEAEKPRVYFTDIAPERLNFTLSPLCKIAC